MVNNSTNINKIGEKYLKKTIKQSQSTVLMYMYTVWLSDNVHTHPLHWPGQEPDRSLGGSMS